MKNFLKIGKKKFKMVSDHSLSVGLVSSIIGQLKLQKKF